MTTSELTLNDLDQMPDVEMEGFDPEADPFAAPPPPDDGKYLVRLRLQEGKLPKKGTDKNDRDFYSVSLEARIVKPGNAFDNRPLFDNVNTVLFNKTTKVAGILRLLGIEPSSSGARQVVQLAKALEGEGREIGVKTRWTAQYKNPDGKYEDIVKGGQRNFPMIPGSDRHAHVVESPDGQDVAAQAKIIAYLAVEKVI